MKDVLSSLVWHYLLLLFLISEQQNKCLMEPHRAVKKGLGGSAPSFLQVILNNNGNWSL